MIEVTNLTKRYGIHTAVKNLSFHVEKGQIYGFLGPNGAGKSTTMNIITGYLAATEGTVKINGYDILKEPEEAKKCIGYLPELPPLYMDMTVEEYLKFVAELKKVPVKVRKEQMEEIMEKTGITEMRNRLIKNLSKGYKQRVGLAQALIGYPEVIILDEPSVGLDPKQIIEMREFIRSLAKEHTVILSSHILSEVSAVCDRIMIISHGSLVAGDTAEGLQKRMGGSSELKLTIRGERQAVMAILSSLEEAKSVEEEVTEEADGVKVTILTEKGVDIREQVFYKLAEAHMPILSMQKAEKSLEDIFLELTQENPDEGEMQEEITVEESIQDPETEKEASGEKQEEEGN